MKQEIMNEESSECSSQLCDITCVSVPSAPPLEIKCEAQSSQSLLIKWQQPPQPFQNGLIQGYKVYYENMEEWPPGKCSKILYLLQIIMSISKMFTLTKLSNLIKL